MAIRIECAGCHAKLTIADELNGKQIRCPKCKTSTKVDRDAGHGSTVHTPASVPAKSRSARLGSTRTVITQDAYGRGPVQRSIVTLRGTVHSWIERHEAEKAAWAAPGVTEVHNYITVSAAA